MNLQLNNIVLSLFFTALLTSILAVGSWQRRSMGTWANSFTVLLIAAAVWSFGYALEIGLSNLETVILWAKLQYFGIVAAPVAWFTFARQYAGRAKSASNPFESWRLRLAIIPAITLLLVFTNESHGLIWASTEINSAGPYSTLVTTYGGWFWVHSIYSYLLMLGGTITLCSAYFRFNQAFRMQSFILLLSAIMPWAGNILFISGVSPLEGIDFSPFGFGLTGILLTLSIYWGRLFDLVPVARRVAVENMGDGIIILDSSGRIVDINPAGEKMVGKQLAHLIGMSPAIIPTFGFKLDNLIHGEAPGTSKLELIKDGKTLYYRVRVSPILDNNQVESGRLISMIDITVQEQYQHSLAKRTQLLETLNSLSTDITSSLDLKIILDTVVKSAAQLLEVTSVYISEYDLDQKSVQVIAEYFSPEASQKERQSDLGVVYDLQKDFDLSADWLKGDGELDPSLSKYIIQCDAQNSHATGKQIAHLAKHDCKTAIKVPLQSKDKLIGNLELWDSRQKRDFDEDDLELIQAIAQQTSIAMYNAKLYEEAIAASELKSRILTQINHELRTPLSVILVYTELFETGAFGPLTQKQLDGIQKVISSSTYLHTLVEQLLAQSEFEYGKVKLNRGTFDAVDLAEQVNKQLSILAEEKGLTLKQQFAADFPAFQIGDKGKIRQIMFNLVSNAIKYTDEGEITLSLFQHDAEHWTIQVNDTGMGIELEDQEAIFEPFWQTSGTQMGLSRNGTGLGLSIVRELVMIMNGEIEVKSSVDEGSTFTVILPFQPSSDELS
ncbi:MAG: histidine kinase N-terminal 7TM domain-containing protein [Anaerolineae bacterium]